MLASTTQEIFALEARQKRRKEVMVKDNMAFDGGKGYCARHR